VAFDRKVFNQYLGIWYYEQTLLCRTNKLLEKTFIAFSSIQN